MNRFDLEDFIKKNEKVTLAEVQLRFSLEYVKARALFAELEELKVIKLDEDELHFVKCDESETSRIAPIRIEKENSRNKTLFEMIEDLERNKIILENVSKEWATVPLLYRHALKYCSENETITLSQLQRRFRISFGKAFNVLLWLTKMKVISHEGSAQKKVFITRDTYEKILLRTNDATESIGENDGLFDEDDEDDEEKITEDEDYEDDDDDDDNDAEYDPVDTDCWFVDPSEYLKTEEKENDDEDDDDDDDDDDEDTEDDENSVSEEDSFKERVDPDLKKNVERDEEKKSRSSFIKNFFPSENRTLSGKSPSHDLWSNENDFKEACVERISLIIGSDARMTRHDAIKECYSRLSIACKSVKRSAYIQILQRIVYEFGIATDEEFEEMKRCVFEE